MTDDHYSDDLVQIEQFILDLEDKPGENNAVMRERLESARFYLTGSMPQEYDFTLGLARQVLPDVESQDVQQRLAEFLRGQESRQR